MLEVKLIMLEVKLIWKLIFYASFYRIHYIKILTDCLHQLQNELRLVTMMV